MNLGWWVRAALAAAVFLMAVEAFRLGVDVSARPGVPQLSLLAQGYYAAGLFVLGGMDLGTPVGGPRLARALLWLSYFSAPLITTSSVVEGLRRVSYGAVERFGMRRHLVVAGLGRLGMSFVAACRSRDPLGMIVAIDSDVNRAAVTQAWRQTRVHFLPGDIRLPNAFAHLALEHARGVALLTDDDLLNLEIAFRLAKSHPQLRIIAHCSDLALERSLADAWGEARTDGVQVFNSHRAAAQHLYDQHLRRQFARTEAKDTLILVGLGRFAQTILELLGQLSEREIARILIAAPAATLTLRKFHSHVQTPSLPAPKTFDADLTDPDTWQAVDRELAGTEVSPTVIICSEDESVNLQSAILARRRWPESRIFVRCQNESSFTQELARSHRFTVLAVEALLLEALSAARVTWFGASAPRRSSER